MSDRNAMKAGSLGLTEAEIAQFHQQGFLGPFTAFTPEQMEEPRSIICERVLTAPSTYTAYRHQSRHLDSTTIWNLCTAPAIADKLVSLYGPDLMLWYSNLFDKVPERTDQRGEYPWHQDLWHWKLEPLVSLSVWMAITPATFENGCVELIPGSHRFQIPVIQSNNPGLSAWFGGMTADPTYFNEAEKVPMVLQPGQFFLFNEATLHHSNPNRSDERRIGLSFRVTLPSVKSDRTHPCVVYSGTDRYRINPLIDPPKSEPDVLDPALHLPDPTEYGFDQPLHGIGWHLAELHEGDWLRWTGPEKDSWLDFRPIAAQEAMLTTRVLHTVSDNVLESLQVRVNDVAIPLSWRQEGRYVVVEGNVSAEILAVRTDRVRVSFHVAEVGRFCDIDPNNRDMRELGLALAGISLVPKTNNRERGSRVWNKARSILGKMRRMLMPSRA